LSFESFTITVVSEKDMNLQVQQQTNTIC